MSLNVCVFPVSHRKWFQHPREWLYFFWKMGSNPMCLCFYFSLCIWLIKIRSWKWDVYWTELVVSAPVRRWATFCLLLLLNYHHHPEAPHQWAGTRGAWEQAPQKTTTYLHLCHSEQGEVWDWIQILCSAVRRLEFNPALIPDIFR